MVEGVWVAEQVLLRSGEKRVIGGSNLNLHLYRGDQGGNDFATAVGGIVVPVQTEAYPNYRTELVVGVMALSQTRTVSWNELNTCTQVILDGIGQIPESKLPLIPALFRCDNGTYKGGDFIQSVINEALADLECPPSSVFQIVAAMKSDSQYGDANSGELIHGVRIICEGEGSVSGNGSGGGFPTFTVNERGISTDLSGCRIFCTGGSSVLALGKNTDILDPNPHNLGAIQRENANTPISANAILIENKGRVTSTSHF